MNELQVFKNDEFSIKSLVIDNEPWFVGKDVAEALGYAKPLNAIAQHVDNDDSLKRGLTDSLGRLQKTIFINESGLYSLILSSKSLMTITQIAKDYGMSGKAMNQILHDLNIQYKQSGQWLLYSRYQSKGYTSSETIDIKQNDGKVLVRLSTKWTQKGRLYLYERLKKEGYLPLIEQE